MAQYKLLNASKLIFKILGVLALVLCLIIGAGGFIAKDIPMIQKIISLVFFSLIGVLYLFMGFLAAEAVAVLLEIKNNTQKV